MKNNYTVYLHTSPSGKAYVGITQQRPELRWQGGLGYRHNEYFFRAIVKYGWENFTHEILYTGLDRETACAIESEIIRTEMLNDKRYGYNLTDGGDHFTHSPASRQLMSARRKGKGTQPKSEATRKKMREHHTGGNAPKRVVCLTTGKIYDSINDAARDTGVDKSPISRCCRRVAHYNTAGGLRWAYYEEQGGQPDGSIF